MVGLKKLVVDLTPPIVIRATRRVLRWPARPPDPVMRSFVSTVVGAFSQYGEDLIVDGVLGCRDRGFYVDIGANDPVQFNNTKRFHERGWSGISVEANPTLCARIQKDRPNDTNLNMGVGEADGLRPFYRIEPDTLSSFDAVTADSNVRDNAGAEIVEVVQVQVRTLAYLFSVHLATDQAIDFMSLDIEGGELAALRSNDWNVWRPRLIMLEINRRGNELVSFLESVNYDYVWSNSTNGLFRDRH